LAERSISREGGREGGSVRSEAVRHLYVSWTAVRLKGEQHDEAWGDLLVSRVGSIARRGWHAGAVLVPKGCAEDRVLLCMHGGGSVGGSIYSRRKLFGHLSSLRTRGRTHSSR
jgi:hypothetical protein